MLILVEIDVEKQPINYEIRFIFSFNEIKYYWDRGYGANKVRYLLPEIQL